MLSSCTSDTPTRTSHTCSLPRHSPPYTSYESAKSGFKSADCVWEEHATAGSPAPRCELRLISKVKRLSPNAVLMSRVSSHGAGYDLSKRSSTSSSPPPSETRTPPPVPQCCRPRRPGPPHLDLQDLLRLPILW
jgi:hypothetical protein